MLFFIYITGKFYESADTSSAKNIIFDINVSANLPIQAVCDKVFLVATF